MATCDREWLLESFPCSACLSDKELLAAIVYALGVLTGVDDSNGETLHGSLEETACIACMTQKQMKQSVLQMMVSSFGPTFTVDELRDKIKCMMCLDDNKLRALGIRNLCRFTVLS